MMMMMMMMMGRDAREGEGKWYPHFLGESYAAACHICDVQRWILMTVRRIISSCVWDAEI